VSLTSEAPVEAPTYARAEALAVALKFVRLLKPRCERLVVAGSLRRRRKAAVKDIEILFIPKFGERVGPADLFGGKIRANLAEDAIAALLAAGLIAKRSKSDGTFTWGEANKLAIHLESGIPVDLFAATEAIWFNLLVCRTGPKELNIQICAAAQSIGWKWNPYGEGFSRPIGLSADRREVRPMRSERDVFEFVGLEYLEPWER
jgi:DNA polymerase/3'-5' exonuclease PolX